MPQLFNHKDKETQREMENIYQNLGGGGDMEASVYDPRTIAQDLYAGTGTAAPSETPDYIGQRYVNTTNLNVYLASETNGSYNWAFVGKGGVSDLSSVSGLTSWYKGENITPTTNGSTITAWNDAGSALNHCTNIVGTPQYYEDVVNGHPGAYFDGSESMYGSDKSDVAQPQTHFVVFKGTDWGTGAEQDIVTMYNFSQSIAKQAWTTVIRTYAGGNIFGDSLSDDTAYMATAIFDNTSSSLQINDASAVTGTTGTGANTNSPNIGAASGGSSRFTGYVMEWMVFTGSLIEGDQDIVRAYLNNKYAIY